ncbi:hypothetical protein WN51_14531 [Melipona quadrifasciata]|uniref:Uncharacterized protein n=1 Tax=Melipona quadrifasciata TaxID=166423 RepID=A0A0M8ZY52_9HYME|nr:hypothetical protein WN51_14531 [Melipona quadrifasciata]
MVKSHSTNVGNAISSPSWLANFHSDSGATFGSVPKAAWTLLNSCINITLDNPPSFTGIGNAPLLLQLVGQSTNSGRMSRKGKWEIQAKLDGLLSQHITSVSWKACNCFIVRRLRCLIYLHSASQKFEEAQKINLDSDYVAEEFSNLDMKRYLLNFESCVEIENVEQNDLIDDLALRLNQLRDRNFGLRFKFNSESKFNFPPCPRSLVNSFIFPKLAQDSSGGSKLLRGFTEGQSQVVGGIQTLDKISCERQLVQQSNSQKVEKSKSQTIKQSNSQTVEDSKSQTIEELKRDFATENSKRTMRYIIHGTYVIRRIYKTLQKASKSNARVGRQKKAAESPFRPYRPIKAFVSAARQSSLHQILCHQPIPKAENLTEIYTNSQEPNTFTIFQTTRFSPVGLKL